MKKLLENSFSSKEISLLQYNYLSVFILIFSRCPKLNIIHIFQKESSNIKLKMNPLASSDYCLKWNDHHNVFFSTGKKNYEWILFSPIIKGKSLVYVL